MGFALPGESRSGIRRVSRRRRHLPDSPLSNLRDRRVRHDDDDRKKTRDYDEKPAKVARRAANARRPTRETLTAVHRAISRDILRDRLTRYPTRTSHKNASQAIPQAIPHDVPTRRRAHLLDVPRAAARSFADSTTYRQTPRDAAALTNSLTTNPEPPAASGRVTMTSAQHAEARQFDPGCNVQETSPRPWAGALKSEN